MSTTPPPSGNYQPPPPAAYPAPSEGRSVAFFVALFLGLLLLISAGINVVLLLFTAIGSPASFADGGVEDSDAGYRVVAVDSSKASSTQILRIRVDGAIAEGASPLMGATGGTVSEVRRQLRFAKRSGKIKGVLLAINSPGGGVTDSDEIHRLITEFRAETEKPVLAYFGDMSASGGYYIAAACDAIYCRPTTITGSIGVIMSSYNVTEAMKKVGVETQTIISPHTPYKDMMSMTREMKPEEERILLSIVEEMYQRFVQIVDDGRPGLTHDQVQALANGQIYSAQQAKANGLVDDVLLPDAVRVKLQEKIGAEDFQMVEQRRLPSLMDTLLGTRSQASAGSGTASLTATAARFLNQTTGAKFLYFWPGGR